MTFLYSTGFEATAVALTDTVAEATMASNPVMNIGSANFSIMLCFDILSPIGYR